MQRVQQTGWMPFNEQEAREAAQGSATQTRRTHRLQTRGLALLGIAAEGALCPLGSRPPRWLPSPRRSLRSLPKVPFPMSLPPPAIGFQLNPARVSS